MLFIVAVICCIWIVQSYQESNDFVTIDLKDDPNIVGDKIYEAASTLSWFYVINHGMTEALSDNLWSESASFFDWDLDEKLALSKNSTHYGYLSNNTEKHDYRFQSMPDLKEIFHVQNYLRQGNESFPIQNQWPSSGRLPNFKSVYESQIAALTRVALKLNEYFALSLNLSASHFEQSGCFDRDGLNGGFRVIKYDRTASDVPQRVFGCGAHSDFGMFTILYSNGVQGLQFKDEHKNYWYDVPFVKNAYVVTVGNVLNRLSNDVYLPTAHRVAITDMNKARYSMVLFWTPKLKCLVQCLPSICSNETNISPIYEPILYGEYITRKVQEIMEDATDSNADKNEFERTVKNLKTPHKNCNHVQGNIAAMNATYALFVVLFIFRETVALSSGGSPSTIDSDKKSLWEMIHPSYEGVDGELLWHIYYGDLSHDERFDVFRSKQLWDTQELQGIIVSDTQLQKYVITERAQKYDDGGSIFADLETSSSSSGGMGAWVVVICVVIILVFAYRYKCGTNLRTESYGTDRTESKPLLNPEKNIQYDFEPNTIDID